MRFKGTPPYIEFVEYGEKPYSDQPEVDPYWALQLQRIDEQQERFWREVAAIDATQDRLEQERATRPVRPENV